MSLFKITSSCSRPKTSLISPCSPSPSLRARANETDGSFGQAASEDVRKGPPRADLHADDAHARHLRRLLRHASIRVLQNRRQHLLRGPRGLHRRLQQGRSSFFLFFFLFLSLFFLFFFCFRFSAFFCFFLVLISIVFYFFLSLLFALPTILSCSVKPDNLLTSSFRARPNTFWIVYCYCRSYRPYHAPY